MKTNRIFTAICIIVCVTFFAISRNEVKALEDEQISQSTTSNKGDTTATEQPLQKGSAGQPLPGGKGTSSTRAKAPGQDRSTAAPADNTRTKEEQPASTTSTPVDPGPDTKTTPR